MFNSYTIYGYECMDHSVRRTRMRVAEYQGVSVVVCKREGIECSLYMILRNGVWKDEVHCASAASAAISATVTAASAATTATVSVAAASAVPATSSLPDISGGRVLVLAGC